jgi:S1-C subfamily serine protease
MRVRTSTVFVLGLLLALRCHAGLVEIVAKAKSSLVAVGTFSAVDSPRFGFRGTGFAVADGTFIVTNAHVLPDSGVGNSDARIAVRVATGPNGPEVRPATVVSIDGAHDLALLKIAGTPLPALAISPSQDIREGQSIALMGFPIGGVLGFRPVTHRGIISAITPIALPMPASRQLNETTVQRLRSGTFDFYQLDATAYPGNSGGPVMDADTGEVVGVISMVLIKGTKESALTHPSGISYAMPASYVQELLKNR